MHILTPTTFLFPLPKFFTVPTCLILRKAFFFSSLGILASHLSEEHAGQAELISYTNFSPF